MKIGFEVMLVDSQDTGVGVAIRELLWALVEQAPEHEFVIYTRPRSLAYLPQRDNVQIRVSRWAGLSRASRIHWQQRIAPYWAEEDGLDIYHAPGYIVSPNHSVPTVLTVYDTIALDEPHLTSRLNALHYSKMLRRGLMHAQRILVPSGFVYDRVTSFSSVEPTCVKIVPLGVSIGFKILSQEEISARFRSVPSLNGSPFVLCVGTLERKKNLTVAIDAYARWRQESGANTKLVIAGKAGNETRLLRRRVAALGLENAVTFVGYVEQATLAALYNRAALLLYPSFSEGFGLPPLEAMACGTPVLVSNRGSLPETVGFSAGKLSPKDSKAWASAIRETLDNNGVAETLEARGLDRAKQFTWRHTARSVLDMYEEVVMKTRKEFPTTPFRAPCVR